VPERIQKVLANAGLGSRRVIGRWVAEGRVTVDGRVAKLGEPLTGRERIFLDGKRLRLGEPHQAHAAPGFLAFYKAGSTRGSGEEEQRSVPRPRQGRWIDVSPLDVNTSGLVVLTTDGELASRLMHPATLVEREYAVRLLGEPSDSQLRQLEEGIELDDGIAKIAGLARRGGGRGSNAWYHVTLDSTRHRDLRPALAAVGLAVSRVIRVRYHTIELGELYRGASRPLLPNEWKALYTVAGVSRNPDRERTDTR
jgi:23S rRNA pseudouridine2605 synthase